jgi:hypothetical protein
VQLETRHKASIVLPPSISATSPGASAKKLLALIADQEGAYQESLGDAYHEMGEKTFKGLRRALPLTRQKLDWDKVRVFANWRCPFFRGSQFRRSWDINSVQSCQRVKGSLARLFLRILEE